MSRFPVVVLVSLALLACATSPPPAATETELQVQRASDAFSAARERGDAASFAAMFTDDGIFMVPGLPDAAGREAVLALAQQRFEGDPTEEIKIVRRDIQAAGDTAYELAWYSETDRRPDQSFRLQGRQFILWKLERDNVWRVQRYLYSFSGARPVP